MPIIHFPKHSRPRDYVYAMSEHYLLARAIHFCVDLDIAQLLKKDGIAFADLAAHFSDYSDSGLRNLLVCLASYGLFKITDGKIFSTSLSCCLQKKRLRNCPSAAEWQKTYNLGTYLEENYDKYYALYTNNHVIRKLKNNSLSLSCENPQQLVEELSSLHLVSRTLRYLCQLEIFNRDNSEIPVETIAHSPKIGALMLTILTAYGIIDQDQQQKTFYTNQYSSLLHREHPQTLFAALLLVDEPWWNCAALLAQSYLKDGPSAFVVSSGGQFYETYVGSEANQFLAGMAAISLLDNSDVAAAISDQDLSTVQTMIDIGAGDGSLLQELFQRYPEKNYILFEKAVPANNDLQQRIPHTTTNFDPQIVLGDFFAVENNIPQHENALYIIKCCLHNFSDQKAIEILQHIKSAMGENSYLIVAERGATILPLEPHLNRTSAILMRLLFKAESRTHQDYVQLINAARLELTTTAEVENYHLYLTEKTRALEAKVNLTMS